MARHQHGARARATGKEFEASVLKALIEMRGGFCEATSVAGHMLGRHVGGADRDEDIRFIRQVRAALRKMWTQGLLNARWNYTHTQITGYRPKRVAAARSEKDGA